MRRFVAADDTLATSSAKNDELTMEGQGRVASRSISITFERPNKQDPSQTHNFIGLTAKHQHPKKFVEMLRRILSIVIEVAISLWSWIGKLILLWIARRVLSMIAAFVLHWVVIIVFGRVVFGPLSPLAGKFLRWNFSRLCLGSSSHSRMIIAKAPDGSNADDGRAQLLKSAVGNGGLGKIALGWGLELLGFGPLGPIVGTLAAARQAVYMGLVPADGLFALLQRLAMTLF
ncbi:hypothetical protein CPLU01_09242 [Colletotrichum plurivorum]|uniref:Uncharacterized protein n=1 Tax=Colletotrichum plurivorum TaxID=2175906 RepID=A0A8H6K8W5_9PEZI|nr:hypothetical protein CPLU01_09242 [Colletotrichum plurivorum]